jgi:predicted phosphodiesterase
MTVVGVISDTHGLLRPEALAALSGSDLIVHAGDIGPPGILDRLRKIAPVTTVRGRAASYLGRSDRTRDRAAAHRLTHAAITQS